MSYYEESIRELITLIRKPKDNFEYYEEKIDSKKLVYKFFIIL